MTQCVDLRADDSIRKASIAKGDSRINALASRDLVAAEAWYHGQCYRDYTRPDKRGKNPDLESGTDSRETNFCNIASQAYDNLFEFIRSDLLENPRIIKMADLRENLMSYMRSMGATEILESTKKHFRRKLEREFGDLLQFEDLLNQQQDFCSSRKFFKGSVGQRDGKIILAVRKQQLSI